MRRLALARGLRPAHAARGRGYAGSTRWGATQSDGRAHSGVRVAHLINAFRDHGHSVARLDPLGIDVPGQERVPEDLRLATYGFTPAQLDQPVGLTGEDAMAHRAGLAGFAARSGGLTVRELHARLAEIYTDTFALEAVHCRPEHMRWLYDRLETAEPAEFAPAERRAMYRTLSRAHTFEATLASRYQSVKRFGIEGGEAIIVGLNGVLRTAAGLGVTEVVLGMPHRGR
jgi:2-oxoglutarate dehydrogenase E1 component